MRSFQIKLLSWGKKLCFTMLILYKTEKCVLRGISLQVQDTSLMYTYHSSSKKS